MRSAQLEQMAPRPQPLLATVAPLDRPWKRPQRLLVLRRHPKPHQLLRRQQLQPLQETGLWWMPTLLLLQQAVLQQVVRR